MDRRAFLGIAGSLLAAPLVADAQQARKVHEVGIVWGTFPDASKVLFEPLREALLTGRYSARRQQRRILAQYSPSSPFRQPPTIIAAFSPR
jgi:hypothetical protein